ncbi:hypothetical protein BHM03_00056750, partial [Ensete ventricosum]
VDRGRQIDSRGRICSIGFSLRSPLHSPLPPFARLLRGASFGSGSRVRVPVGSAVSPHDGWGEDGRAAPPPAYRVLSSPDLGVGSGNSRSGLIALLIYFFCYLFRSKIKDLWVLSQLFYESFDEPFEGRWIVSEKEDYKGLWEHSKSDGHEDYGLLVSEKARKYAIVKELDEPVILKDGTVVLQFEVRLQNGLECGGSYLKYLRPQGAGWSPKGFDNESPYSIMFGPDKCGSTNKVHFILQHKNPKTGKFVEHHLKYPPSVPSDKLSHVYTAILKHDNELRILVDGEEKKKTNFFSADDFEPALIPPKTIPDPDDKKPEDWDERAKIPDPDAVKPDDWDEDAPMEIEDEEAVKPEGWLDDEPEEVDDPEATKPEDWDEDEDGEWEAPKIDNPKCESAPGCGEWKRPMKRNPEYKGKWHAPLIDNPNYKGIWKPQEIDNPDYFELDKPDFEPIAAIGIEIWTMQDGILFDNILITGDEKVAESYRAETWKPKYEVEKEKQKAEDAAAESSDVAPTTTETRNSGAAESEGPGSVDDDEKEENDKDDASAPRARRPVLRLSDSTAAFVLALVSCVGERSKLWRRSSCIKCHKVCVLDSCFLGNPSLPSTLSRPPVRSSLLVAENEVAMEGIVDHQLPQGLRSWVFFLLETLHRTRAVLHSVASAFVLVPSCSGERSSDGEDPPASTSARVSVFEFLFSCKPFTALFSPFLVAENEAAMEKFLELRVRQGFSFLSYSSLGEGCRWSGREMPQGSPFQEPQVSSPFAPLHVLH